MVQAISLTLFPRNYAFSLKGDFWGSVWAKIGAPHWAFMSHLNGFLAGRGMFIGWNSLSSVNSCLLEWGAEEDPLSARINESESARATAINQNSLILLNMSLSAKVAVIGGSFLSALISLMDRTLIVGALDRWGVLMKTPASTRSRHCNGWVF